MEAPYLQSRLDFLRKTQNPDGGWGFFPNKASWFEPTFYALLALHGDPADAGRYQKGWTLARSWQAKDGGWRPSSQVDFSNWTTAFGVTLCTLNGVYDDGFRRGVEWLLETEGSGNNLISRFVQRRASPDLDTSLEGWPWMRGTANWTEPTAHAITALRKAAAHFSDSRIKARVDQGERMLLNRRCKDGGWNYGNPWVYTTDLPSYPETTALGLMGLQARAKDEFRTSIELGKRLQSEMQSPLAQAWLTISLRNNGVEPAPMPETPCSNDVLLTALEALADPLGNHRLLRTGDSQ